MGTKYISSRINYNFAITEERRHLMVITRDIFRTQWNM